MTETVALTWADEIDLAMMRGGSPYSANDVLRWLREGRAELYVWPSLRASAVLLDGRAEIGHVFGTWTMPEARELWDRFLGFADRHGVEWTYRGRAGWVRFLQQRGFAT